MHLQSKTLFLIILCALVLSQKSNSKTNVQDNIAMCVFNEEIRIKAEYSSINIGDSDVISWTPCTIKTNKQICPQNSLICLNNKVNLGSSFVIVKDEYFYNKYRLESRNGDTCKANRTRNYVVHISFNEYSVKPHLQPSGSECEYHITIPDPKAAYPCTKIEKGYLLDFRLFTDDFIAESGNDTYIFNLCGPAAGCGDMKTSSCVTGPQSTSFGEVAKNMISYDEKNGVIEFQFKTGTLSTKIDLHCNWTALYGVPRYLKSPSNKMKKFIVDSSLGCIKLPMECKIQDLENYKYDLSGLYKDDGNWKVSNGYNRNIEINICGPLQNPREICKDQYSQVCETIGQDKYYNYGSILVGMEEQGGNLKGRLVHGSVCPENTSLIMTTDLTFKCSFEEKGPRLFSSTNCSLDILWETPKACPTQSIITKELDIHDHLGHRNLADLCKRDDWIQYINSSSYIKYNLCKPLKEPCNNIMNVSACLHIDGKQAVLGYYKEDKLISKDGVLYMELYGDTCKELYIYFVCDYSVTEQEQVFLQIKHDNCIYNMFVKTAAACVAKANLKPDQYCTVYNKTLFYNLTGLTRMSENYKLTMKNSGIQFIINICNPVITEPQALCSGHANICLYNLTEPNVKRRFSVIGAQISPPIIEGDNIVVNIESGDYCSGSKKWASGVIYFKCSHNESGPKLIEEKDCSYTFSWETQHACPKRTHLQCIVNEFLDLKSVEHQEFKMYKDESTFIFNICSDNYTRIYQDGSTKSVKATRDADEQSLTFHVDNNVCSDDTNDNWNKVRVIFSCRKDDGQTYEVIYIRDCTAHIRCYTRSFCKQQTDRSSDPIMDNILGILVKKISDSVDATKNFQKNTIPVTNKPEERVQTKFEEPVHTKQKLIQTTLPPLIQTTLAPEIVNICKIKFVEEVINLNELPPLTLNSHSGDQYSIGLGNSSRCNGYICKGNLTIATLRECPIPNHENSELKVIFNNTKLSVGSFTSTIIFKCNLTMEYPRISGENETSFTLVYPTDRICSKPSLNAGLVTGIVILVIIIVASLSFVAYRSYKSRYVALSRDEKSNLIIYCRNTHS